MLGLQNKLIAVDGSRIADDLDKLSFPWSNWGPPERNPGYNYKSFHLCAFIELVCT